jgi:hypothetical protein
MNNIPLLCTNIFCTLHNRQQCNTADNGCVIPKADADFPIYLLYIYIDHAAEATGLNGGCFRFMFRVICIHICRDLFTRRFLVFTSCWSTLSSLDSRKHKEFYRMCAGLKSKYCAGFPIGWEACPLIGGGPSLKDKQPPISYSCCPPDCCS